MVFDDASISKYYREVFILKWDDDEYIQTAQLHRKPPFARQDLLFSEVAQAKRLQLHPAIQKTLQDVNSKDFRKCLRPRAQLLWSSCIVVVDSVIPCMSSLAFRKDWNLFGILL